MERTIDNKSYDPRGSTGKARACPLCGEKNYRVADVMERDELVRLWGELGVRFSEGALKVFAERTRVELFECSGCGFQFFNGELAGNDLFYAELQGQSATYYPAESAGFARVLDWSRERGLKNVLDVGCGAGGFLELAGKAGLNTSGIELNPKAAALCREKGHTVHSCSLGEFGRGEKGGGYDLVTAFEVLEHVPDPVDFLGEAARLTAPGGYVAVTVPNRNGVFWFCDMEPHQWPPHHVTRWRLKDLRRTGERCGLELVRSGGDLLAGREIEHFWKLRVKLMNALGRRGWSGLTGPLFLLTFLYRKTGAKYFFPRLGPSIYAIYRKRAEPVDATGAAGERES